LDAKKNLFFLSRNSIIRIGKERRKIIAA